METIPLPPVYRPRPYQKPTAPLVKRHNTSMPDEASIASFIYSGSEKNLFSRTPILMLHGNGEEHGIFGRVIDAMVDRGYDVIAMDSRDQGESTRGSGAFTYERMTADAAAVLDDLGVTRAHVLGFSDGGIEGLLLARDYVNKVASLTVIGANLIPKAPETFLGFLNTWQLKDIGHDADTKVQPLRTAIRFQAHMKRQK